MKEIRRYDVNEDWAHSGIIQAGDYCFINYCARNIGGTIEEQIEGAFDVMEERLALVGLTLENVVQMNCLFKNIWDIPVMEKVIKRRFHGKYPVRKSIQTEFADPGNLFFQVDGIAYSARNSGLKGRTQAIYKLAHEKFIRARDYIFVHGDDINRAWFRYLFEDNDTNRFLDVLSKYQHEDGGFGGIYYEFDYQGTCLKTTEIAVKYILNMKEKPPASHPLIQNMMRYILGLYIPEIGNWGEIVVPAVNDGAHCYWIGYEGENTTPIENEDERIKRYEANQKVCFAAFVSYYSELVPEALYHDIIKYPTEYILRYWDENSPYYDREIFDRGEPYDMEYFQWFVPCLKDKDTADRLASILCQNPTAFMELDYAESKNNYVHLPCDVVGDPKSVVYPVVKDLVLDSLKYRMDQQSEDGKWPLGWSFGDDEELQKLQMKYETYCTLAMLEKLDRFDMIER